MTVYRTLRLSPRQRRTFVSYLFGITALASIMTVSASDVLPCPALVSQGRFAEGERGVAGDNTKGKTVIEKRPRRWIEEKHPTLPTE
ncbi:hypothetical protein ABKN59_000206 [Abortiporus biennis]